jgi:hypothetical protein
MRAKLAFVTRISGPIYRRGQQGENHTNSQLLMMNLYNPFPVTQMNKPVQKGNWSAVSIGSSSRLKICGEQGGGLSR